MGIFKNKMKINQKNT